MTARLAGLILSSVNIGNFSLVSEIKKDAILSLFPPLPLSVRRNDLATVTQPQAEHK